MKKYFLLLIAILVLSNMQANAQAPPDSVLNKYHTGSSQEKNNVINSYLSSFKKNDSLLIKKSLELVAYFQKQNDDAGANIVQLIFGKKLLRKNDYNTSLNYLLQALSGFKARNDTTAILSTNSEIGYLYQDTKNYLDGVKHFKDNLQIALATGNKGEISGACNMLGTLYAEAFMPDSGLVYAQRALNIAYELKNDSMAIFPLGTIAENYIAKGDYDLALSYLRKSQQYHAKINYAKEHFNYTWTYNDYAQAYLGMKQHDSTIYYSQQSLSYSIPENWLTQQLRTYEYLYKSFDALNRQDSSYKYFKLVAALKDSLFSSEKVKAIEATNFREVLRQQELEIQKLKTEEERQQNIQYALIALGIVSLLILFFLLSRSIIVTEKWISFFGILGLLIVFEFINLLIHPFLERVTHHSPLLMLLALVAIASLLIPMHHKIEKWIKDKMTEKNKKIRLDNARKTIEQLEEKPIQIKEENE